jgi:hypothetical protein
VRVSPFLCARVVAVGICALFFARALIGEGNTSAKIIIIITELTLQWRRKARDGDIWALQGTGICHGWDAFLFTEERHGEFRDGERRKGLADLQCKWRSVESITKTTTMSCDPVSCFFCSKSLCRFSFYWRRYSFLFSCVCVFCICSVQTLLSSL